MTEKQGIIIIVDTINILSCITSVFTTTATTGHIWTTTYHYKAILWRPNELSSHICCVGWWYL